MTQPRRRSQSAARPKRLTVAVTGPTGDLGRPLVDALERSRTITRVIGMARRPFDPDAHGWRRTEYRRGDVLDRASVDELVAEADVVVHLAFLIMGGGEDETRRVNLEGSRNVFEATMASGRAKRLVYASSVAAYGFHPDNPQPLTEDVPARGSDSFYYSAQKAELERLLTGLLEGSSVEAYVLRPCVVAGPQSLTLVESLPYVALGERMPDAVRSLLEAIPILRPVLPDPGVPFQLVHADDVAAALRAAIQGRGTPGVYNLAADGELTMSDVADAMGWYSVAIPDLAMDVGAGLVARLPFLPPETAWLQALRTPVLMDSSRARARSGLGWRPRHSARQTLRATVDAARRDAPVDQR